eukprot:TRINITY_DN1956_c0_g1_i3.p1 TRINITY_DN1956_c0_g1~~TRINITY_DN1956_c0_g1_i3.p1  ORF type:complete len:130 (-),score=26.41 TRINITY_DN1956_c0_g1_i3:270-659(-)
MLSCFAGCGICGLKGAQRRQSTPDAASEPTNVKVTPAISDSPESASTRASTVETAPIRKRDVIRQKLFGSERTLPSESVQEGASFMSKSSFASTATRMRKRDWIQVKLGMKKLDDVLEQDVIEEEAGKV